MGVFNQILGIVVFALLMSTQIEGTPQHDPAVPYDFLYNEGIDKYLAEDWEGCIKNLEMALEDWHWWQDNVIKCRRNCSNQSMEMDLFSTELLEEDKFFERSVHNTLCLVKCKKGVFGSRMDRVAEGHIDEDFDQRKPYDYLQLCYYQSGQFKEAADAAATVLARQPEHEVMKNNLNYYLTHGKIAPDTVLNKELKKYGELYIRGNNAYNNNEYDKTIAYMEQSLAAYYEAEDDCRRLCEKPFDQGWFPDFISSIANHYTFTLRCKRRCPWKLSNLYGEHIQNFYASYFNYLQYSYYQEGKFAKASEAVASVLFLDPEDDSQISNKAYYMKEGDVTKEMFVPRKDVVAYKQRLDYEEKMMDYIEKSFLFLSEDEYLEDVDDDVQDLKGDESPLTSEGHLDDDSLPLESGLKSERVILPSENIIIDEL